MFVIESTLEVELKPDAFYTALLYAYNHGILTTSSETNTAGRPGNSKGNVQVVIGDIPQVIQREQVGRAMKVQEAQEMFKKSC